MPLTGTTKAQPPDSKTLNYLAVIREEAPRDEGSTADEAAAPAGSGWRGSGKPMMMGTEHISREMCDGQSLASPGSWPPQERRFSEIERWMATTRRCVEVACRVGTPELLMKLSMGLVDRCPFADEDIRSLRQAVVDDMLKMELQSDPEDRKDVLLDYRNMELLLKAAGDPGVALASFAKGVEAGMGGTFAGLVSGQEEMEAPKTGVSSELLG